MRKRNRIKTLVWMLACAVTVMLVSATSAMVSASEEVFSDAETEITVLNEADTCKVDTVFEFIDMETGASVQEPFEEHMEIEYGGHYDTCIATNDICVDDVYYVVDHIEGPTEIIIEEVKEDFESHTIVYYKALKHTVDVVFDHVDIDTGEKIQDSFEDHVVVNHCGWYDTYITTKDRWLDDVYYVVDHIEGPTEIIIEEVKEDFESHTIVYYKALKHTVNVVFDFVDIDTGEKLQESFEEHVVENHCGWYDTCITTNDICVDDVYYVVDHIEGPTEIIIEEVKEDFESHTIVYYIALKHTVNVTYDFVDIDTGEKIRETSGGSDVYNHGECFNVGITPYEIENYEFVKADGPFEITIEEVKADFEQHITLYYKVHEHIWGEWQVMKEATYTTTGVKNRSCTGCDAIETEKIERVTIPTPTLTSATATAYNKITFKWKKVSGIDGYRIYRKTEGSSSWKSLAYVTSDKTSYVDSTVVSGTKYVYTVKAYCKNGSKKIYSAYNKTGKSAVTKAKAPTLSSAKATAGNQITFTWKSVSGVDGYRVYRKTSDGSYKKLADVNANTTSYVDKTAKAGTTYTYTVKAYHTVDGSKLLGYYKETGKNATAKAKEPTLSSAKATAGNQITFTWKSVSGVDGYRVYRKTADGSYKKLADVNAGTTSYVDKTAKAGTTYTYTVKAYNTVNGSKLLGYYKETGKTATAKAKAPTLSSVSALGSGKVKVTWKSVSGVDGYRVYRKTAKGSWKVIATVSSKTTSYTDKTAKAGMKYYYTVKAYNTVSGSKLFGFYNTKGKSVTVK